MRKSIIACAIVGVLSISCFQVAAQKNIVTKKNVAGFVITGNANDFNNEKVILSYENDGKKIKDSTIIKDGKFTFKGIVKEPVFSQLTNPIKKIYVGFFLENNSITVNIDKSTGINTVSGSQSDAIYKEWANKWKLVTQKAGGIYQRMDAQYKAEGKNPNDRNAKLSDSARKGFDKEFAGLNVETDSTVFTAVRKYPNSVASAFIVVDRYVSWNEPTKALKMYNLMSNNVKNSIYGKQIKQYIEVDSKTTIGVTAPDFILNDSLGKPFKLSSLHGQYVLVDFWASWCGPCRKENPNVVKAYAQYHPKGLEIVGVSLDSKREAWVKAITDDKLNWIHVSDLKGWSNAAAILYGVKLVPTNVLLDKTGKIIGRNLRGEDLENKLAQILK